MKKIYIQPHIKKTDIVSDGLMVTFSLPTTGKVNDPSVGETKEWAFDDEEDYIN